MYTGIILYNTEKISPDSAYEFADELFKNVLNIPITDSHYIKPLKEGGLYNLLKIMYKEQKLDV